MAECNFGSLYKKLCAKHRIEKQDFVIESLNLDGCLNFSNRSVSVGTCAIIGKIVETTNFITEVNVEGCMIDKVGLKPLFLGLETNRSVACLNLKGNSIKNDVVLQLANLLTRNSYISRLLLEWNNLGICVPSFAKFCEALESNHGLKYLDLKSNELDAAAAPYIGKIISSNSNLTHLDLGFNNFGNVGGKVLVASLRNNLNLLKLDLVCNNIYEDTLNEIESQLFRIRETKLERDKYLCETDQLKQTLFTTEERSSKYIQTLEKEVLDNQSSLSQLIRDSENNIHTLKDQLGIKVKTLESLQTKFSVVTVALEKEKGYNSELAAKCHELDLELQNIEESQGRFTKQIKEKETESSQLYQMDKDHLQCIINKYEVQMLDVESKWKCSKTEVFSMKEKIISLEAEITAQKCESEDALSYEGSNHKNVLRKLDRSHSAQLKKLQANLDEKKNEMKKTVSQLEMQVEELEKDLRVLRTQSDLDKETQLNQISSLKNQMKTEQSSLKRSYGEKSRNLEDQLQTQGDFVTSLTSTNIKQENKILSLTNELSSIKIELDGKENVMRSTEIRVRNEFKSRMEELELLKEEKITFKEKVLQKQNLHESEKRELESIIRKHSEELTVVQMKLNEKENDILRMKQDESKRIGALQSAFVQYFQIPSS